MEKPSKNLLILIGVILIIIIGAVIFKIYFLDPISNPKINPDQNTGPKAETPTTGNDSIQKAIDSIPANSNPIPSANPLDKTANPFDSGYKNPFNN